MSATFVQPEVVSQGAGFPQHFYVLWISSKERYFVAGSPGPLYQGRAIVCAPTEEDAKRVIEVAEVTGALHDKAVPTPVSLGRAKQIAREQGVECLVLLNMSDVMNSEVIYV